MSRLILFLLIFLFSLTSAVTGESLPKTFDVIIVGGGIAGLTAAYYLEEGDTLDVLLLEKENEIGGRATSGQYRSVSYSQGAEYLGLPEEPLSEIIDDLGLVLREIPAPADIVFRDGTFHYGELGKARLLVRKSSLMEFNRFVLRLNRLYALYDEIPDLSLRGELARLDTITARDWFVENNFPQIYHEIYNVASRGLFGASLDDISALSALPEFAFDFDGYEAVEDEDGLREEFSETRGSTGMYTFDGGIGALPLALGKQLAEVVQTGTEVQSITRVGEYFEITCIKDGSEEQRYRAEAIIIATPAPVALKIVGEELGDRSHQLLGSVTYAPYTTVALFSDEPIFTEGFDLVIEDGHIFTDLYNGVWITNHFSDGIAEKNGVWVTLAYVAPQSLEDKESVMVKDAELLERVLSTIDLSFPEASKKVTGHNIRRFRYGFPVMTPGSYRRMMELIKADNGGIFLAGDYLVYPTFEAAAASGQLAAENAREWLEE